MCPTIRFGRSEKYSVDGVTASSVTLVPSLAGFGRVGGELHAHGDLSLGQRLPEKFKELMERCWQEAENPPCTGASISFGSITRSR